MRLFERSPGQDGASPRSQKLRSLLPRAMDANAKADLELMDISCLATGHWKGQRYRNAQ